MNATPFGFRILGSCTEERRLVDHAGAFFGYASLDPRAAVDRESYLSAFQFGDDFREILQSTGSCRGFAGACWSPWLWIDIDREGDLDAALVDTRRLALGLVERYRLDDDPLLVFYSGAKGFHVGLSTYLWTPAPSTGFHSVARQLAEGIACKIGVAIDTGVYDRVRAFRAPNSRHPKTGRHKRRLTLDELTGLSLDGILQLAEKPQPFDVPTPPAVNVQATADWQAAERSAREQAEAKAQRQAATAGAPTLNRATLAYIRDGAETGDRHRLLFSAAANLGEFGCPPALAHALLSEAALDAGLSPSDVRRQIECGLAHGGTIAPATEPATSLPMPSAPVADPAALQSQLAALWAGTKPQAVDQGDSWEHPLDRLGSDQGPYGVEGGRR